MCNFETKMPSKIVNLFKMCMKKVIWCRLMKERFIGASNIQGDIGLRTSKIYR